jgi:hypothetical protein
MDRIIIEIIGCFVWVTGNTNPHREHLKTLRFHWHSKKLAWYLAPEDYRKRSRKEYELDEIREMYGTSGAVKSHGTTKIHGTPRHGPTTEPSRCERTNIPRCVYQRDGV